MQWLKDDKSLVNGENYIITDSFGVCSLEITCCRVKDSGKYSCRATNSKGTAETSCHIKVGKIVDLCYNTCKDDPSSRSLFLQF